MAMEAVMMRTFLKQASRVSPHFKFVFTRMEFCLPRDDSNAASGMDTVLHRRNHGFHLPILLQSHTNCLLL